ncbi:ferritin-like domain-containing protein [Metabacillus halosaccharovorans]|uniref:ferritin-like domain-containing protein n=1 Tax=Metabacillus halosaccharovorans TaxID=930124 RepID=UPI0031F9DA08
MDKVGERVARLGVVPTAHLVTQHEISYIKHEVEGRYTMRDYLRNDLEHEIKIQGMMRKTINRAHELHDFGTVQVLEDETLVRGMEHLLDGKNDIVSTRKLNDNLSHKY